MRLKQKVKNVPRKKLNEISVGEYITVKGKVAPYNRLLKAPLSGKACAAYQTRVVKGDPLQRLMEADYISENTLHRFYLIDGEREILVICQGVNADLQLAYKENIGIFAQASQELRTFLEKHGERAKLFGITKFLIAEEKILAEGQEVSVVGNVAILNTRHDGKLLVLRGTEKNPMYIKV